MTEPESADRLALLARESAGAIEVDLPDGLPLKVMLAGPIKVWWQPGEWDSPQHQEFVQWRDAVETALVRAGFLVYRPHCAWRGAWHEDAQIVNDTAIETADVMLDVTPPGVPAVGTAAERAHAERVGTSVVSAPPGTVEDLEALIALLGRLTPSPQKRG